MIRDVTVTQTGKKQHPSGVQLSERLASVGFMGAQLRAILKPPGSSQHHRNEGYKRSPSLGPSYAERRSDLIFCQSGQIHRKMTNIKKSDRNAFIGDLFFVAAFDFRN